MPNPRLQDMPAVPVEDVPRYLAKGIALFEVIDDDLLPIKPLGIQVTGDSDFFATMNCGTTFPSVYARLSKRLSI